MRQIMTQLTRHSRVSHKHDFFFSTNRTNKKKTKAPWGLGLQKKGSFLHSFLSLHFPMPFSQAATPWVPPGKPLGFFFLHHFTSECSQTGKNGHCHRGVQPTPPRDLGWNSHKFHKQTRLRGQLNPKKKMGERKRFIFDWQVVYVLILPPFSSLNGFAHSSILFCSIPWLVPLPSDSHHQDFLYVLTTGFLPIPSFAANNWEGGQPNVYMITHPKTLIINDHHQNCLGTAAHSQRSAYCAPVRPSVKRYAPGRVETSDREDGTTVDGWNPKQPPGMYKTLYIMGKTTISHLNW